MSWTWVGEAVDAPFCWMCVLLYIVCFEAVLLVVACKAAAYYREQAEFADARAKLHETMVDGMKLIVTGYQKAIDDAPR